MEWIDGLKSEKGKWFYVYWMLIENLNSIVSLIYYFFM